MAAASRIARTKPVAPPGPDGFRHVVRIGRRNADRSDENTLGEATMSETRRIPADQLTTYFDAFSKRFLMAGSPGAADIEVIGTDIGNQRVTSGARLLGVDYDPHTNALEIELDTGEHRAYRPREVWAIEEPDGFITGLQIIRSDGAREVVQLRRGGIEGHG